MATDKRMVQIRLTQKLYKRLEELAKSEKRSVTNMVEVVLTRGLEERKE